MHGHLPASTDTRPDGSQGEVHLRRGDVWLRSDPSTGCEEEALLNGCRRGYGWAWRELYRRYQPVASAFLRKLGVVEYDLEDCSQDVFMDLHRYLGAFRNESQFRTWLYRICASHARRSRRRKRMAQALQTTLPSIAAEQLISTPGFSEERAFECAKEAAQRLSPSLREALLLFEIHGLSGKAVANLLNCPEATVWRRLHDARKALTAMLLGDQTTGGIIDGS